MWRAVLLVSVAVAAGEDRNGESQAWIRMEEGGEGWGGGGGGGGEWGGRERRACREGLREGMEGRDREGELGESQACASTQNLLQVQAIMPAA